ncbi:hypothetical protein KXV81_007808 [Aspergillus fumigatus]|nr:hypothetical protein KXX63_003730 [Aspergillus fumigatus]KAH1639617.1 hypothetical protein KXX59_001770 [Aspergillus fumigatus]KAH1843827.1 hypothetical protein KXX54_000811 [Aspergillus fumigatus]KAH1865090.1 hypothetical protein KXX08_004070 [Aspergillus fumigatus]KAH2199745.1 hypothetical protein KXW59_003733 [Aspergillus fumigatus]
MVATQMMTSTPVDMRSWQTVFRLPPPDQPQSPPYHARRPHKKSRAGCLTCKRRRVKCDETRPFCRRCEKLGAPCSYGGSPRSQDLQKTNEPDGTVCSLSLKSLESMVSRVLATDSDCFDISTWKTANDTRPVTIVAFQHFTKYSTDTVGNPFIRQVMKSDMIRVAFGCPHLMYTILGVGSLHLNRIRPQDPTWRLAEVYFWQQAIKAYQAALSSKVSPHNVDELLSTCMFMGITSLCPDRFQPTDSWVLTNAPGAMNWLCLQSGIRTIIKLAGPYIQSSIWASAFQQTHQEEVQLYEEGVPQGREGLDPDLADLCGIDDSTTAASMNPYYEPLRLLAAISGLEKNMKNAAQCASFMGRLDNDFLALLRERDPPALLILAQWMGLLCTLSEWQPWSIAPTPGFGGCFCSRRARADIT